MKTTIESNYRIFVITENNYAGSNPVLCNIQDLPKVCESMPNGVESIKHFWNGKVSRISKADLKTMLKAHDIDFNEIDYLRTSKTKECSKVLQLMDQDYSYSKALKIVLSNNKQVDKNKLEKELNHYI